MSKVSEFIKSNKLWVAVIILGLITTLINKTFLSPVNLNSLLTDVAIIGLLSLGQMLVILTGGIDLSVGNIASAATVFVAYSMIGFEKAGMAPAASLILSIVIALAAGALMGALNGFGVAYMGLTPMLSTLAGMWIAKGLSYVFLHGAATPYKVAGFKQIAMTKIAFIPLSFLGLIGIILIMRYILKNKRAGRAVYAVGGNEYSAYLSGIKVKRTKLMVYLVSGLLSAAGGLILGAYTGSSYVKGANGYEMHTIAVVVIAGFAMTGGIGNIKDILPSVIFIRMLNKVMIFLKLSNSSQDIYIGIILLVALLFSTTLKADMKKLFKKPNKAAPAPAQKESGV